MRAKIFLLIAVAILPTGCAKQPGQNQYGYQDVGQSTLVEFGTVVSVREVGITDQTTGAGALLGAGAGAGAGAYVGQGSGNAWAVAGGAIAGAVAGSALEQAAADRTGIEYTVTKENGQTVTIVQNQNKEDKVIQVGQRVMHDLRAAVFRHLQRLSLAFFTRTRTGEVQSRITNDIGGMQSVVTSTATSIASNLTTAVASAVAMAALSWQLSLISLVVMPPAIYLTRRVARMRRAITTAQQRELADLNVTVEEGLSISGIRIDHGWARRTRAS